MEANVDTVSFWMATVCVDASPLATARCGSTTMLPLASMSKATSKMKLAFAERSVPLNRWNAEGAPGGAPLSAYTVPVSVTVGSDAGTPVKLLHAAATRAHAAAAPARNAMRGVLCERERI